MNRIVRDRFPVSALPEELRRELVGEDVVKLTIEHAEPRTQSLDTFVTWLEETRKMAPRSDRAGSAHFSRFFDLKTDHFADEEQVAAHIRTLRDDD
jgi:hypothetical protein